MKTNFSIKQIFWFFTIAIGLLRLRAATQFDLGVDEAHYMLYGKYLAWSYFDHPPLVGWTQALFQLLPFNELICARLAAILISAFSGKLIFDYLIEKKFSDIHSLIAVMALNLTPAFNAVSIALLPDTFLIPLTLLILNATENVINISNRKNWLLLGLYLGMSALAKYTAILYVFALVLIFFKRNKIKELFKPNLWLGVAAAFILILPILYWNYQNNFASFQYQTNHVLKTDTEMLKKLSSSLAIQILSWGIGPFIVAILGFLIVLKNIKYLYDYLFEIIFLGVFLLFFIYVSVGEVLLPHWMVIFFILAIPLFYAYFLNGRQLKKLIYVSIVPSALISLALLFELGFKVFPAQYTAQLYEGVYGWPQIVEQAQEKLKDIPINKKALAVMNWTLGSRALFYSKDKSEVFVLDTRKDQFDIWNQNSPVGYDFVVMIEAAKKEEHLAHLNCAELKPVGEQISKIKDVPVNHFLYYHCVNFLEYR